MQHITVPLSETRRARVVVTDATDGDLAIGAEPVALDRRRSQLVDLPWTWLRQVHGAGVVPVGHPGDHVGADGDALVTARSGAALAVQTADCGSLALIGRGGLGRGGLGHGGLEHGGAVAAVHAGWRGVVAGIVPAAVRAVRDAGGSDDVVAVLGPCIHAECYEFSPTDRQAIEAVTGPGVWGRTAGGSLAFDLPAALRTLLHAAGVYIVWSDDRCTSCGPDLWSHRARGDRARQGLVVWIDGDDT